MSMAFTCGCRIITTKNIIEEYGLKSAIDYDATDELVSMDPSDIYEEAERIIKDRNDVYDSLMSPNDYHLMKPTIDKHVTKIKEIVEASGELCEGNVFWSHYDPEPQEMSKFLNKRINLFNYSQKAQSIMEIGFNAGHSSLLFLLSNPTSTLQIFDLGVHRYTRPCFEYLSSQFPNRMKIEFGDSRRTVPIYIAENTGKVFDMIHIDGGHDECVVKADILNSIHLSDSKTVIISDDDELTHIARMNRQYFDILPDALPTCYQYVGVVR
jgi:predicted O-methyltransferase YrrM